MHVFCKKHECFTGCWLHSDGGGRARSQTGADKGGEACAQLHDGQPTL